MSYINTSAISGYAGIQGTVWWFKRLVKKGAVPLFSQEDIEKASELPDNHPYNNKLLKTAYVSSVVLYILSMFGIPFLFYLIQRIVLQTPEMIFFNNTMAAVLSIFPSLLFGFWLCYFLYLKMGEMWPDYRIMASYSTIIGANRYLQGGIYDKTKWEKLIKPNHLETLKDYEEQFFRKATVWILILTLPMYGLLFYTYKAATVTTIIESTFGRKDNHQLNQFEKIEASLTFKEEKNNGKYELKPTIKIKGTFKDGDIFNFCDFSCYKDTGKLIDYLSLIKTGHTIPIVVTPLKAYQKELLQKENPTMFLFYQQLVQLGR